MISRIKENIRAVKERIEKASLRANRNPEEIKLVAVTKMVDTERIKEAIDAGVDTFGENYVQEAEKKIKEIGSIVSWHFIGHLQRNKVKYAIDLFDIIHSLDSEDLAIELDKRGRKAGKRIRAMIEVNLSEEESKYGIYKENLLSLINNIKKNMINIKLEGLMTIPPFSDNPENSRPYFRELKNIQDELNEKGFDLKELSIGMSNDFEVAIEEGATMVRIGSAIFGPRG
jgi:hypothetical protein